MPVTKHTKPTRPAMRVALVRYPNDIPISIIRDYLADIAGEIEVRRFVDSDHDIDVGAFRRWFKAGGQ